MVYNVSMFGLMKPLKCSASKKNGREYRFYYCGTCKTIGALYGNKMRFFLNHDVAFFAEILANLDHSVPDTKQWHPPSHRANCFALPRKQENIPLPYVIASAVNVLLAKFTIDNKIEDAKGNRLLFKWLRSLIAPRYTEAVRQMKGCTFPVERIAALACQQSTRENHSRINGDAGMALNYFCEPTAIITGIIFQHASRLAGKPQHMQNMYAVGFNLGKIVYLLDAWEDFQKDFKRGNFNAIAAAYQIQDAEPGETSIYRITEELQASKTKIIKKLHCLPIPKEKMRLFSRRLEINLYQRLKARGQVSNLKPSMWCDVPGSRELPLAPVHVGIPQRSSNLRIKAKRYFNASLFALSQPIMFRVRRQTPPDESGKAKRKRAGRDREDCCCDCCCTFAICDCCSDCDCDFCDCCDCDC
jgi:hypothetical protein